MINFLNKIIDLWVKNFGDNSINKINLFFIYNDIFVDKHRTRIGIKTECKYTIYFQLFNTKQII